jgi:hypothetical protein
MTQPQSFIDFLRNRTSVSTSSPTIKVPHDCVEASKNLDSSSAEQAKLVSRRGGHTLVFDDGDFFGQNNLIRLRSASGHQITMSDDGQTLFIIHSNGQSYIELGKEGTVDIYATNSFNIRTKGDLNLHADNNININAKKQLNIFAEELNINSDKNTNVRVGENYSQQTVKNHTVKVDQSMSFLSKSNRCKRSCSRNTGIKIYRSNENEVCASGKEI